MPRRRIALAVRGHMSARGHDRETYHYEQTYHAHVYRVTPPLALDALTGVITRTLLLLLLLFHVFSNTMLQRYCCRRSLHTVLAIIVDAFLLSRHFYTPRTVPVD
jgi:hypothetical protein|uniref:Uncharacterized protein n=1 Tax=Sipha flava TaxID=143950 RepID=A0A2S2Q344_9HEMI